MLGETKKNVESSLFIWKKLYKKNWGIRWQQVKERDCILKFAASELSVNVNVKMPYDAKNVLSSRNTQQRIKAKNHHTIGHEDQFCSNDNLRCHFTMSDSKDPK